MADSHREEIAKLEALYAGNPGGRVFVHLAEAYRKAGEHERARRILDDGLARHPDSASGHVVLGRVLADMQITDEAETAFRRVLNLDGGNLVALRWLGDLARQSGRNAEAASHYRELLARNPSNEEVRDLVEIVERQGTPAPAAAEGSEALSDWSIQPEDTDGQRDEPAVSAPVSDTEEPAVTPPAAPSDAAAPDMTPWSAAPGQTADAQTPPVEYGLVEVDTGRGDAASDAAASGRAASADGDPALADAGATDVYPDDFAISYDAPAVPASDVDEPLAESDAERAGQGADSDMVASYAGNEGDLVELDDLRRDDEAEPAEIHLLDPSFEAMEADDDRDDDDFAGELDLSDLAAAGTIEEEGDYADDTFVADLAAAGAIGDLEDEGDYADDTFVADLAAAGAIGDLEEEGDYADDTFVADLAAAGAIEDLEAEGDYADDMFVADLAAAGAIEDLEEEGDYADDTFVPDLAAAGPEEPEPDDLAATDVMDTGAALTLLPGDADAAPGYAPDLAARAGAAEPASESATVSAAESDLTAPPERGASDLTAPPESEPPALESEPERVPDAETSGGADTTLVTETMAVLYRSQGHYEMAAEVYRSLLRTRPDDARLLAKLRETQEALGEGTQAAGDDDAGEVWLRGVGTAWTGSGTPDAEDATPYVWTADPDETEAGEPIGSYLKDLVGWKAGSGRWLPPEAEVQAQESDPQEKVGDFTDMPDWLDGPGGSQAGWTPDSEPPPFEAAPADTSWSPAESAAEPDPWSIPGVPAGSPESSEETAEEPATEAGDDGSIDDSGAGWTPLELDDGAAPAGESADEAASRAPAASHGDENSAEDEDLEMFRSWLQSLKK